MTIRCLRTCNGCQFDETEEPPEDDWLSLTLHQKGKPSYYLQIDLCPTCSNDSGKMVGAIESAVASELSRQWKQNAEWREQGDRSLAASLERLGIEVPHKP